MLKEKAKGKNVILILGIALLALIVASLCMGRYPVPLRELLRLLISKLGIPVSATWTSAMEAAVMNIRLPRIALACIVGCCLSSAGVCYQGVFQNPMAAPDLLGASSGAAFGAALAILLGGGKSTITLSAFIFSLITVLLAELVAVRAPGKKSTSLILAGVMISSLFTAGTSYIKLAADPYNQLPQITYWLMGSLSGAKTQEVLQTLIPVLAGLVPLVLVRWRLNLLTLGDDEALTMGVNAERLRLITVICATLVTAASVSVSGMIGWIGLVVPHLCRKMVGNDYRTLLPSTMLLGALFLLLVDDVSRNLLPTEIPIGILTSLIGAPFFLYLITRKERSRA